MKVALCVIGRLENRYALEYVEYYKDLGFDKIFVYDNNRGDEEHFEDVLGVYISMGFVEVVNFRDRDVVQLTAYTDCYQKHSDEYDWIAFFDFDEFLVLVDHFSIKSYLGSDIFNGYDCIKVNWMVYTDGGLVKDDGRGVLERFVIPMDYDRHVKYSYPENNHVKSIIRGGVKNFKWVGNPHVPGMSLKYCDSLGKRCDSSAFQPYNFEEAYLKHFPTKTIDEYINRKNVRGVGDRNLNRFKETYCMDYFWKINERTSEKEEFIKNNVK
jgi:hypothetical protein